MKCPYCPAKETRVKESKPAGSVIRRRRRCENGHTFTSEEMAVGHRLKDIAIRHSGDRMIGSGQSGRFNADRLRQDVHEGVLGLLTDGDVRDIVHGATSQLRDELPARAHLVTDLIWNERTRHLPGERPDRPAAYVWDTDIREVVENQLRLSKYRVQHVLYAMAFLGRADRPGRSGWHSAEDVLNWLFGEHTYVELKETIPQRSSVPVYTWRPTDPGPRPTQVLKAGRVSVIPRPAVGRHGNTDMIELREAGRVVEFDEKRFRESINRALLGRPGADEKCQGVAWWVLTDLQGVQRVHSAQLAVGVLDCLRRVDEIAYLRWVTHFKRLSQVTDLKDEAFALITHPDDKLAFDRSASPRKPVSIVGSSSTSHTDSLSVNPPR